MGVARWGDGAIARWSEVGPGAGVVGDEGVGAMLRGGVVAWCGMVRDGAGWCRIVRGGDVAWWGVVGGAEVEECGGK